MGTAGNTEARSNPQKKAIPEPHLQASCAIAVERAQQDIVPGVAVVNFASTVITAAVPGRAHIRLACRRTSAA
jgi:hypothetical protein